jgi:hypothetical protein
VFEIGVGDKGATGAPGGVGDKGVEGDKGAQGETGGKGDQGETGGKGAQGGTGDKGDQGDKGATGDQGDKGGLLYKFESNPNVAGPVTTGYFRVDANTANGISQIAVSGMTFDGAI